MVKFEAIRASKKSLVVSKFDWPGYHGVALLFLNTMLMLLLMIYCLLLRYQDVQQIAVNLG